MSRPYEFLIASCLTIASCSSNNKEDARTDQTIDSAQKTIHADTSTTIPEQVILKKDTIVLAISKNEEDLPINDYRTEALQPIRANFKKLNSITEWTAVDKRKLENIPANGVAEYYYIKGSLQKIIAYYHGEKEVSEFYLLDGQLSMAVFKSIESSDDYKELIIDKNYFKNSKLLHKIHSQDCGAPFADDYIKEEQKRILGIYNQMTARLTN